MKTKFLSIPVSYCVQSESEIAQLCPTLCDPMDCKLPGPSIPRILQARVLEGVASMYLFSQCNFLVKKKSKSSLQWPIEQLKIF